jgi:hypothetical protein
MFKEIQEIQKGSGARAYIRNGFLLYEEMCQLLLVSYDEVEVIHDFVPDPFKIYQFFLRVYAEQVCVYTGDRCLMVGATGGEMRSIVYRILSSPRPFSTCNTASTLTPLSNFHSIFFYSASQRVLNYSQRYMLSLCNMNRLLSHHPNPPSPVSKLDSYHTGRLRQLCDGRGGGAKSYLGVKAWSSINYSILSAVSCLGNYLRNCIFTFFYLLLRVYSDTASSFCSKTAC